MIDLFITTFGRKEMFKSSLNSLLKNTNRDLYRLTIVVDGGFDNESEMSIFDHADRTKMYLYLQSNVPRFNS